MPITGSAPNQSFIRTDGVRTAPNVWPQAQAAGVGILASAHEIHDQDISDGVNVAVFRNGGNLPTADLPMGGFRHTNVGSSSSRASYGTTGQIQDGAFLWGGTAGGTANALTITLSPAIVAYAAGQAFSFKASANCTAAATLNVNGVGAVTIKKKGNGDLVSDLEANDITTGLIYEVFYDGANFQIQNPSGIIISARTENDTTEREFERATSGSGAGNTYSRRLLGSASNAVTTIRDYIGATKVLEFTSSLFSIPNAALFGNYQDQTDISTPAAPGAGLTRLYTKAGLLFFRAGAAGAETQFSVSRVPNPVSFLSGTSLTYTPTAGMTYIKVRMAGGGGGGGGATANNGAPGNNSSFQGAAGGFVAWTCVGGGAGQAAAGAPGAGGTGGVDGTGTKNVRLAGSIGGRGVSSGTQNVAGAGGSSVLSGGAAANGNGAGSGNAGATNTGAGGSGAASGVTNWSSGGGGGEYVEFWLTIAQMGATATYTVGAAANGGAAGGVAGGNGGSGVILIEEFFN